MTRDEFLHDLKEAIKTEESVIRIYLAHLSAVVARSLLPPQTITAIKKVFEQNSEDTRRHKAILEHLVEKIQKEPSDVY